MNPGSGLRITFFLQLEGTLSELATHCYFIQIECTIILLSYAPFQVASGFLVGGMPNSLHYNILTTSMNSRNLHCPSKGFGRPDESPAQSTKFTLYFSYYRDGSPWVGTLTWLLVTGLYWLVALVFKSVNRQVPYVPVTGKLYNQCNVQVCRRLCPRVLLIHSWG